MTTTISVNHEGESHGDGQLDHHQHGHEEHADHRMFGLATFLIADGMTFAGFFAAYLTFKAVNPLPAGAIYELELPLPILNTVLLLVSSATFHRAGKALHLGNNPLCRKWLLVSAGLGIAFLVSQMVEYFTFRSASPTTSTPAHSSPPQGFTAFSHPRRPLILIFGGRPA